jgi:hypothetical protein
MFCAQQVAEFRPHVQKLRDAGFNLAVVGSGAPNFARGFRERMEIDVPIFSDEKLASYSALQMHRGAKTFLHAGMIAKGAGALFKYGQRRTMGDATQQGGAIVVRPDGTMPFKFLSRFPGDHAKPETVVAEALKAVS